MALVDKLKDLINPRDDFEDDDDYYEDERDYKKNDYLDDDYLERVKPAKNNVVSLNSKPQHSVVLVKPLVFENTAEISNNLKNKRTIILNLEKTDEDEARRIVDFLSGVAYGIEGQIQLISRRTYIVAPHSVEVLGDLLEELTNLAFSD